VKLDMSRQMPLGLGTHQPNEFLLHFENITLLADPNINSVAPSIDMQITEKYVHKKAGTERTSL